MFYKGYFEKDMKNGLGILYSNDVNNSHIIGRFRNNKIEGKVILKFHEQEENILVFKNNKFCNIIEEVNEVESFRRSKEYQEAIEFYKSIKMRSSGSN